MSNTGHQLDHHEFKAMQPIPDDLIIGPRVIAVGVSDSRNMGTIFRICDAVAAQEIVFVDTPSPKNSRFRQAARNTQRHVRHQFLTQEAFIAMQAQFQPLIALEITSKSVDLYAAEIPQAVALVIGDEKHGVPAELLNICQAAIHIPMFGNNSSMNVATALGIALYEWHRRWR